MGAVPAVRDGLSLFGRLLDDSLLDGCGLLVLGNLGRNCFLFLGSRLFALLFDCFLFLRSLILRGKSLFVFALLILRGCHGLLFLGSLVLDGRRLLFRLLLLFLLLHSLFRNHALLSAVRRGFRREDTSARK